MDDHLTCTFSQRNFQAMFQNPAKTQQPRRMESAVVAPDDHSPAKRVCIYSNREETRAGDEVNSAASPENCSRERLRRHRTEVAGRVWIPDIWGQEELLKDWADCSAFDRSMAPTGIMSARAALVEDCRKTVNYGGLAIDLGTT